MKYTDVEERPYREVVEDLLKRRNIKNRLGMLVWLRNQKELRVSANERRAAKAKYEMRILTQMIEKTEADLLKAGKKEGDDLV